MNRGLEVPKTAQVRVLAVGSSNWLQSAIAALERCDIEVGQGVTTTDELEAGHLDATDCLLTDERSALSAIDHRCPIVCAIDSMEETAIDRLRSEGVTDVVHPSIVDRPSALAHRIRQAVRFEGARRTVSRQQRWYETLVDQSSDQLVVADPDGTITYVDPSVERVSGYDAETLLGSQLTMPVHPEDASTVRAEFDDLRERDPGAASSIEYRCRHANGSWYVHEAVLTNRLDDELGGIVASIRDVTAYQRVERELDETLERVTDAFFALDSEWRFTYVNDRAGSIFGVDPSTLLGTEILEAFPKLRETPFHDAAIEAMETQESCSLEHYFEPTDAWYRVRIYPSRSGISVYFRDVTDRIERERELQERTERLETVVQNVPIVLFVFDADGVVTLAEGRVLADLGSAADDIVGESVFDIFDEQPEILDELRTALNGESTHTSVAFEDRVFEAWCRPITVDGSVERVIGTAVDITERAQYQEALNTLHEATSHLLTVESEQAACEYMVEVAADVLELESVVYRFDDQRNELVPAGYSPDLESTVGRPPHLQPDESITWDAFITDTPKRFDDVRTAERVYNPDTAARSALYVPIGEHGVLVALDPEPGAYDDETFELAKLFARTAEAALDRITRTRRLHGREWELKRQNIQLERLNEASRVRQDIEQLLLMADSRGEIERGICDRLAELEDCSFAWIGEPDPGGTQLHPQAQAGNDREYLEAVTVTTVDESAAEPAGRSARTRSSIYVDNIADSIRDGVWRGEALSRNFQSVYTVPLVYEDFLYGVLALYGDERDAFDEPFRSMLVELGETIAYAIDAVKRKSTLQEDVAVTELELELEGAVVLSQLADRVGARVEYEGATTHENGAPTVFVVVDSQVSSDLAADLTDIDGVNDVSIIAETESETLLQLQYTVPFLGSSIDAHGGTLRALVADGTETRAIVDVPETAEIRNVLSELNRRDFSASLLARREQPTEDRSTIDASARNALLEQLTDRQREVVQTAYHGGFFEWPRRTTGEAIADSLDISSPAFHKHIRAAERKLFDALFDGSPSQG